MSKLNMGNLNSILFGYNKFVNFGCSHHQIQSDTKSL